MWTGAANWMNRIENLKGPCEYRYILGDPTDFADTQDNAYINQFLK